MKNMSGFTIVELLVVIVVLGVLSSVVVVAYGGIQERARNATLQAAMDTLEKGLTLYSKTNGGYPDPTELPVDPVAQVAVACMQPTSSGWLAQSGLSASQCYVSGGSAPSYVGYSTVVRQALLTQISAIPDTNDIITSTSSNTAFRGVMYQYQRTTGQAVLMYYVPGNQSCGRAAKSTVSGQTLCVLNLPNPANN